MKKLALALMVATGFAWAYDATTAFDAGKDFGQQQKGTLKGNVSTDGAQKNIPNYTTSTQETTLFNNGQGSLFTPGRSKVNNCATGPKADSNYNQQECDAVNFLAKNPQQRPQINIDKNDPLVTGSTQIINNAKNTGGFSGCKNTVVTKPAIYEDGMCHEGNQLDTVDCSSTLSVFCEAPADGCDNGGIVPNSTQADMRYWFGPAGGGTYYLEFGTLADNYWPGSGTIYDRTLRFDIAKKADITQFSLVYAAFDDWLLVKVNGTTVYVGPKGGDRLEVVTQSYSCGKEGENTCYRKRVQYGPKSFGNPELATSWSIGLGIDLKPYLVDGTNTIYTRTIVAGDGESFIRMAARMMCPPKCRDEWNNQCAPYEARMQ